MSIDGAGQSQGGSFFSGDTGSDVMKVIKMVLCPHELIGQLLGGLFGGGDSATASNKQASTDGGATTEIQQPLEMPGYAQGKSKEKDEEMVRSLDILDQSWDLFDSANGKFGKDGKVTLAELSMLANDSKVPGEVRAAAQRLMNDPMLLERLDRAVDGLKNGWFDRQGVQVTKSEIERSLIQQAGSGKPPAQTAAQSPVQTPEQAKDKDKTPAQQGGNSPHDLNQFGGVPQSGTQNGAGQPAQVQNTTNVSPNSEHAQQAITDVLNDPNLSFETKTDMVVESAITQAETEVLSLEARLVAAEDAEINATTDAARNNAHVLAAQLSRKFERMMQRRQELHTLLSNMSTMSHDMAMASIRNMKD